MTNALIITLYGKLIKTTLELDIEIKKLQDKRGFLHGRALSASYTMSPRASEAARARPKPSPSGRSWAMRFSSSTSLRSTAS
jgi:hypothetical protein